MCPNLLLDVLAVSTLLASVGSQAISLRDDLRLPRGTTRGNGWACWVGLLSCGAGIGQHVRASNLATASTLGVLALVLLARAITNFLRRSNHWFDVRRLRQPRF